MFIPILLFIVGLILLIKGGDWFVDGATGIAHRFHLPEILIGATVVSIGTTLPEVMVSATSAISGNGEIAYGNAIGSIICNTALVAAITVAVRPSKIERNSLKLPVIFFFIAAGIYSVIAYVFGFFYRFAGVILFTIFVVYMILSVIKSIKTPQRNDRSSNYDNLSNQPIIKELICLIVGAALIAIGSKLLVDNGTVIAQKLGVPEAVIALTLVALGTSLPELVTAITSLMKGHSALSLGNVIGANFFNLVIVSGVSAVISPFSVPNSAQIAGINASLLVDIPVMLFVMALLTLPALIRGKLSRVQGVALITVYLAFCVFRFIV